MIGRSAETMPQGEPAARQPRPGDPGVVIGAGSAAAVASHVSSKTGLVLTRPATPDLAVILPAFNESGGIDDTLARVSEVLETFPGTTEVIVVDDGSTDGTGERAAAAGIRVVTHPWNRGYGAALKTGILNTTAPAIMIMDADCSYPPNAIPRLYEKLDGADMVVGSRLLTSRGVSWMRRPGKWMLNRFASYLVGRHIPDLNSGQRVMKRDTVLRYMHLCPSGFSFTSTITMAMLANGHNVIYEPIDYLRRSGRSKVRASHFASFILLVVRAIVLFNPLKVFLPVGALAFLAGVAKLIQDIYLWNLSETAVMAFLSAMTIWAVGLLADMISRLQMQPQLQPKD
jgi:glycosyltransferase involved in cell wall biosynthesis